MKYGYILFYLLLVQVQSAFSQHQVISPDLGKTLKLDVSLYEGDITVEGYSGTEIVIDAVFTQKNGESIEVQKGADGLIKISSPLLSSRCVLKLKVPEKNVTIKVGTTLRGNIEVNGLQGSVEVQNVAGHIQLNRVSGTVLANTVYGNLDVKMTGVKPGIPLAFSTVAGTIDLSLPADMKADLRLKSDGGTLSSDFDVEDKNKQKLIYQRQRNAVMNGRGWMGAKVNGGGTDILITNVNGNITLRKNH